MLTNDEIKLVDNYFISNNINEMSEAHFFSALHQVVPLWRIEELAGDRVYTHESTTAYKEYIKNLLDFNQV